MFYHVKIACYQCEEQGIQRQLTTSHMPQKNGEVERKNKTVVSLVKSMLKDKSLPIEFLGYGYQYL